MNYFLSIALLVITGLIFYATLQLGSDAANTTNH
jgi:hypothetical protein